MVFLIIETPEIILANRYALSVVRMVIPWIFITRNMISHLDRNFIIITVFVNNLDTKQ